MTLTSKATLIVASTMLFSIIAGLLAREFILNPHLLKIEHAADTRDIRRFEQAVERYRENLEGRIKRIFSAAGLLQTLEGQVNWSPIMLKMARIGGYEELDYFILANDSGSQFTVHAGQLLDDVNTLPSNAAIEQLLDTVTAQLSSRHGSTTSGLLLSPEDGPLVYAAGRANWSTDKLPATYIAVRRMNTEMIAGLGERLGLTVSAISHQESQQQRQRQQVELGQRSDHDTLFSLLKNADGEVVLHMRFDTAPRAFDDEIFSPTITASLGFAAMAWAIVLELMRRYIVQPIEQLSLTMRRIRQSSNYGERLTYPARDELGKLVDECNELLTHVADHTRQLEVYSYKDALTGIGNRRLFQERLDFQWRLARRKAMSLSAVVFDLDYFKQYNDRYGHDGGDTVLREFAQIMEKVFTRDTDVVCRTGGEEFIVLLLDTDIENAQRLAERTLEKLRIRAIPHAASPQRSYVSVSAGLAHLIPQHDDTPETLIRQADRSLYRAKQLGRDQLVVHDTVANQPS